MTSLSGIGRSAAVALLKAGWNVIITGRRDDALQHTVKLADDDGATGKHFALSGDITDEAFVKQLFAAGTGYFGRLDLVFNNAGIGAPQVPIEELSLETFQQVESSTTAPLRRTYHVLTRNAHTQLAAGHATGALQPDGRVIPEATFDVKHVGDSIVHIANLPNDVTVLEYNIMATGVPYVGRG
ncbi:hypothetical protein DXG01_008748 [Tephrocybe rancida]|nr:hypothetical protein DXG01_008748 [Tephrocybe rancida]